ncbi:pcnB [Scenedesmus sp. PABB004]|nr:pcnB [Scenedesmus sp. PABB004]
MRLQAAAAPLCSRCELAAALGLANPWRSGGGWPPGRARRAATAAASGSGGAADGAAAPGGGLPGAEVAVTRHALPAYAADEEEREALGKAEEVIRTLTGRGFKALIAGGWVRDKFLGRRASDIDIATNAHPAQLKAVFRHVIELPRSTVKVAHKGEVLELSTFRGISRAPSLFSVASDARRRDFTINAIYYDPLAGSVLDFVGGVDDARRRVLRLTPPDGAGRLREDPLRALRAVRIVTVCGLRLAPETAAALREHAHLCSVAHGQPPRRIWLELRKLHRAEADGSAPGAWPRALKLAFHLGLLPHLFPWLAGTGHEQAVRVAEALAASWRAPGGGGVPPLPLLVAATLHPAHPDPARAHEQLAAYFQDPADLAAIDTLARGAALAHARGRTGEEGEEAWARFYAAQHAPACLRILAAWMPGAFADGFMQLHQARMAALAPRIARHRQLLAAEQESLPAAEVAGLQAPPGEAVQQRRLRQREELAAAIAALVGEAGAEAGAEAAVLHDDSGGAADEGQARPSEQG